MKYTSRCRRAAQIAQALMTRPMTVTEVMERLDVRDRTGILNWIREFHDLGVIYVHSKPKRKGGTAKVYAWQPKPFEKQDCEG